MENNRVIPEQSVLRGKLQNTGATLKAIDPISFQPSRLISSIGCGAEAQTTETLFVMFATLAVTMGARNEGTNRDVSVSTVRNGAMVERD